MALVVSVLKRMPESQIVPTERALTFGSPFYRQNVPTEQNRASFNALVASTDKMFLRNKTASFNALVASSYCM